MPRYPVECLKVGHRNGKESAGKCAQYTCRAAGQNVIPAFISAALAARVPLNSHLQHEKQLQSPCCPQQCLDLRVLDNNEWEDAHMSAKELQKRKLCEKTSVVRL